MVCCRLSRDDKLQPSAQADVRIKLTLSLEGEGKGGEGGPTMVRQWSEGHWSDVSQDSVKGNDVSKEPVEGVTAGERI